MSQLLTSPTSLVHGRTPIYDCLDVSQVLGGQYHLLERVGRGGMAEVWRAVSRGPAGFEKIVTIKRVLPHLAKSQHFVDMLVREAKIAARLSHANIVQIFDLGVAKDTYFIAMEYVDGPNLAQLLTRVSQEKVDLPLPIRLHIISEIAKGLDFAHRQKDQQGRPLGIVHRDVSPSNILISREGEVKLADFGIATARARDMWDREKGRIRGKVSYMSPEQARGEEVDQRSDTFSLGIVLFELCSGRRLFRAGSTKETLRRVRQVRVPRLSDVAPALPQQLETILTKALRRSPSDRYESAGAFHSDVSALTFSLGKKVDATDLGRLVCELAPETTGADPNKLTVDVLIRALDDATGFVHPELTRAPHMGKTSDHGEPEATAAEVPQARKSEQEIRQLTVLAMYLGKEADRQVAVKALREAGGHLVDNETSAVIALFGFPKAMENAPERAVRVALDIRRRLSDIGLREELFLPSVAVIRDMAAIDRAVSVPPAVRKMIPRVIDVLSNIAPGQVVVTTEVAPILETSFQLRSHGTKGMWQVAGLRRRRERIALAAVGSGSLVGREQELQRVLRALSTVCDGKGRVLLIQGDPLAGKTRLLHELRSMVVSRDIGFRLGRCEPSGSTEAYGLIADLVRDICGIDDTDGPEDLHSKVDRLRQLGLSPKEIRVVGGLFGLEYPVDMDRELGAKPRVLWLLGASRKMLHALGQDQPQVIALEDLHWLDESSSDVVRLLASAVKKMRVLVLLTQRPTSDFVVGEEHLDRMVLQPLDANHCQMLAAQTLGVSSLESRLGDWIWRRTSGNPGFVVELCRMLRQNQVIQISNGRATVRSPLEQLDVPGSVQELVAATLERLKKGERKVLRAAAVVGGELDPDFVRHVAQVQAATVAKRLKALSSRGFLIPVDPDAQGEASRYSFRHDLVRQAVEAGIGPKECMDLHSRAADYLKRIGVGVGDERLETLAEHLARGGKTIPAVDLLEKAGLTRITQSESGPAACHFARAANIISELTDSESRQRAAELGLRAAQALHEAGQKEAAEGWYTQALEVAELAEAPTILARTLAGQASLHLDTGHPDKARTILGRALGAAEALGDKELVATTTVHLGKALMQLGEPAGAAEHLEHAVKVSEGLGDEALMCRALVALASARVMEESFDEAATLLDRVTERALRSRVASERCEALLGLGELALAQNQLEEARDRFSAARDVARRHDLLEAEARAALSTAQVLVLLGEPGQANALAADVSHSAQALGMTAEAAHARLLLGFLDATKLNEADGARKMQAALKELDRLGRRAESAMGHLLLGWAYRHHGNAAAARRSLATAIELAGQSFAPAAQRLATSSLEEIETTRPGD